MPFARSQKITGQYHDCDVALIGGGVMSATFGLLISILQPTWSINTFERLAHPAQESSDPRNNAGTGHSGLCELNYTTEKADGSIDASKAFDINEQFQVSRQLWAHLVRIGVLGDPNDFINSTPHMSFVEGEKDISFLTRRHETLIKNPLFTSMQYTTDRDQIDKWAPLLIEGRNFAVPLAATYDPTGTDVNYGSLTRQLFTYLIDQGALLETNHEVSDLRKADDGGWLLKVHDLHKDKIKLCKARYVFVGAGGYALKLLQKAGLPEIRGYGLFPVAGQFLTTTKPDLVSRHHAKVYGSVPLGAPPMSIPHMDARVIDGTRAVLFGPFAGTTPKFLKQGSLFDLPASLRPHNLRPLIEVGLTNFNLEKYLVRELFRTRKGKLGELQKFAPTAELTDWTITHAGQRAQIIKPDVAGKGALQFGTEALVSADRSMSSVLGASPGASTAVPLILSLLERSFPEKMPDWGGKLREIIPSYGTKLADDPDKAHKVMADTAEVLKITPPTN